MSSLTPRRDAGGSAAEDSFRSRPYSLDETSRGGRNRGSGPHQAHSSETLSRTQRASVGTAGTGGTGTHSGRSVIGRLRDCTCVSIGKDSSKDRDGDRSVETGGGSSRGSAPGSPGAPGAPGAPGSPGASAVDGQRRPESARQAAAKKKKAQGSKPGVKSGRDKDYRDGGAKSVARPRPICLGEGARDRVWFDDECEDEDAEAAREVPTEEISEDTCSQIIKKEREAPAPYFPQTIDDEGPPPTENMGPLNMWANGRVDWSPLAGLTGTRPIVDRHSVTRLSIPEWRRHNLETFQRASGDSRLANLVDFNARSCIEQTLAVAPKNQTDVTARLQQRNADIRRWLPELDKAHQSIWSEIQNLTLEDDRLRRILCTLEKIIHIVGECIEIRTTRMDTELARDEVEEQLCKELGLANEVRQLLNRTKDQIQEQLDVSRAAKLRLEQDMSDKQKALKIDTQNVLYTIHSPTIMFQPGAARFMNNQSTPESWEIATRENICLSENERAKICTLRALIETVIIDSARDLAAQKVCVDDALTRNIELNLALATDLEDQLKRILKDIVSMEQLISDIKDAVRKFDFPLKKAQTRLHEREERPRLENTRDCPQYGLIDEIKSITEQSSALVAQLCQAQDALVALLATRRQLEREIEAKRKTVYIDRDRIQKVRLHYPLSDSIMVRALSQCDACR